MTVLVHWLWQGLLVAMAAGVALRLAPGLNGATRHAILWIGLATVLVLPATWPAAVLGRPEVLVSAATSDAGTVVVPEAPGWVVGAIAGAWLGWVGLSFARLAAGWWRLRRVCEAARPLPPSLRDAVTSGLPPIGRAQRPVVLVSPAVRGACAIGFGRPTILLSASLVDVLDSRALRQVVLHEHAHLERGDHWGRLAQSVVEAVVGVHPAVACLVRRLDLEREVACDEQVVSRTGAPREYARGLLEAAGVEAAGRGSVRAPAFVPGALRSRAGLRARIERLVDLSPTASPGVRRPALAAGALTAAIVLGTAATMAPALVFADAWLEGPGATLAPLVAHVRSAWPGPVPAQPGRGPIAPPAAARRTSRPAASLRALSTPPATALPAGEAEPAASARAELVLEGRALPSAFSPVPEGSSDGAASPSPSTGPWRQAGVAGRAVGQAGGRTGAAIGGAAARGGSAIGQGAKRAGVSLAGFFSGPF